MLSIGFNLVVSLSNHKSAAAIIFLAVVSAFLPLAVFADTASVPYVTPPVAPAGTPLQSVEQGLGVFRQVLTWFATAFWIAAALFAFYAAFLYLTAAGNEQRVKKAHSQLLYAVIAIAIGLMAYGLPALVKTFLGSGSGGGSGGGSGCPPELVELPEGGCG